MTSISNQSPANKWKKTFMTLYIGQAFSIISSSIIQFAIIWWLTQTTSSAITLSIATIVGLLPQAFISPFAGVWIDRYNRKTIMILADCLVALASVALGVAFVIGTPSVAFVYLILFIRSVGSAFHTPAMQAAIPSLVPEDELTRAGGMGHLVEAIANMAGPMFGAVLISLFPIGYVMFADLLGVCLAVMTLSKVTIPDVKVKRKATKVLHEMKEGFKIFISNKALVMVSFFVMAGSITFIPFGSLLPLHVTNYFGGGAYQVGISQTAFSIGMMLASLLIGLLKSGDRPFTIIAGSLFTFGVCGLIGGFLPQTAYWWFVLIIIIMGGMGTLSQIPFTAYIQKTVPQENLGKVLSLVRSLMSFATPIGLFIAGPVAETIGIHIWLRYVGIIMVLIGGVCYMIMGKLEK